MAKDDFAEVQRKLEATASELKTANDPDRRRTLLPEMSRLVAWSVTTDHAQIRLLSLCLHFRWLATDALGFCE